VPRYEYKCKKCGKTFEVIHGINDNVETCRFCESEVRRLFHPVGIVFKGSGFYSTDSKSAGKKHHAPPAEDAKDHPLKAEENGGKDKKKEKDKKAGDSVKATS